MFKKKEAELDLTELKQAITSYSQVNLIPLDHRKKSVLSACLKLLSSEGYYIKEKLLYFGRVSSNDDLINYFYVKLSTKYDLFPTREFKKDKAIAFQFVGRLQNDFNMTDDQARALAVEIIHVLFECFDQFNFTGTMYTSFAVFGQGSMKWVTDKALSLLNSYEMKEEKDVALGDALATKYLIANKIELGYDLDTL